MGKFTQRNFSEQVLEKLDQVKVDNQIWVDSTTGNDSNDGSELNPLQSFSALVDAMKGKLMGGITTVRLKGDFVIDEELVIGGQVGMLTFEFDPSSTLTFTPTGSLKINYVSNIRFDDANITIQGQASGYAIQVSAMDSILIRRCTITSVDEGRAFLQSYGGAVLFYQSNFTFPHADYAFTYVSEAARAWFGQCTVTRAEDSDRKLISVNRASTVSYSEKELEEYMYINPDSTSLNMNNVQQHKMTDDDGFVKTSTNVIAEGITRYDQLETGFYYFSSAHNDTMEDKVPEQSGYYVEVIRYNFNDWCMLRATKNANRQYNTVYIRTILDEDSGWIPANASAPMLEDANAVQLRNQGVQRHTMSSAGLNTPGAHGKIGNTVSGTLITTSSSNAWGSQLYIVSGKVSEFGSPIFSRYVNGADGIITTTSEWVRIDNGGYTVHSALDLMNIPIGINKAYTTNSVNAPQGAGTSVFYVDKYQRMDLPNYTVTKAIAGTGNIMGAEFTNVKNDGTVRGWIQTEQILETGTNTNGTYVKYTSGRLVCYTTVAIPMANEYLTDQQMYIHPYSWTLPMPFVNTNYSVHAEVVNGAFNMMQIGGKVHNTKETAHLTLMRRTTITYDLTTYLVAEGRWK